MQEKQNSYFSTKTYVVGAQKNRLNETVLLSTQDICSFSPSSSSFRHIFHISPLTLTDYYISDLPPLCGMMHLLNILDIHQTAVQAS